MHTLIILTAVVSSLPPELAPADPRAPLSLQVFILSPQRASPSTTLQVQKGPRFHPLKTLGHDTNNDKVADRVFLEFLAGAGLGTLGGGLTGWAMGSSIESPTSLVIPISVLLLGNGVGVALAGTLLDGRGRFAYAMLGSIIGSVVPIAIGIRLMQLAGNVADRCFGNGCAKPVVLSLLGLLVLPAVGAIVGYELSAPKSWLLLAHAPGNPPAPRQVAPVLTLARQGLGGTVGLAWRL
jgi:hypothetical protein